MPDQRQIVLSVLYKCLWLPLLVLPGLFSTSHASVNSAKSNSQAVTQSAELTTQQKTYLQAQEAYKKRQFNKFSVLTARLEGYPLHSYLEYKALLRNPSSLTQAQISKFLHENDNTVIGSHFRSKIIKHAARTANWQRLLDVYRPGYGTLAECRYLNALIHTQQALLAYPKIKNLWLTAKSQPKGCDGIFKKWQAAGKKTPELIWARFTLAITANNRKLATYLIKSMPLDDARTARLWLKVHKTPTLVSSPKLLTLDHPDQSAMVLHGLKRLASKNIDLGIKTYHQLSSYPFSIQEKAQLIRYIGLKLARQHKIDAGIWLARVPESHVDKQVREWQIRTAIRQGDWSIVRDRISLLDIAEQSNYRWQFWWAYANEQLGNANDAQGIFQYLAEKRSYYGFLAADHIDQAYKFEEKPVELSADIINEVSQQDETIRARELYQLNKIVPARREWHRLIARLNTQQKLAASKIAQSWNWHDRAIVTMGKTRYRDDIELRFPMPHDNKVFAWSSQHRIDPAWTYAIIRRESAFMGDARSSVGALGLMQLMPNTARYMARQLKIRYRGRNSLLSSNTNIRLGTGYLGKMLNKLDSQQVLATAAYNAGPHRVKKWLPEHQQMDAIRWIETIPFTETREYVSNVLAYMAIYEHRLDRKVTRLSHRMPPVQAKNPPAITQLEPARQTPPSPTKPINDPS